jgi:hypothetical protein
MFVPKGYLPLTAAVDQLAAARRADETSGEARDVAKAELRAELHSGSISAIVVSRHSGDTFAIRSQHWARDQALTWLESGECLLAADFVDPLPSSMAASAQLLGSSNSVLSESVVPASWPSLRIGERATIFVGHEEFQRVLAGKQELSARGETPTAAPAQVGLKRHIAEAKIEPVFERWRKQQVAGSIPTEDDDFAHMRQFGVSREIVRELRKKHARKPRGRPRRRQISAE